jgi:REP element-mobilizing transposase RayT
MPQSLSFVLVHLVFSTKDRAPSLKANIATELYPYLASVARDKDCECYRIGGVEDHVHLAVRLSRTTTVANLVEQLKTCSSKWLKSKSPILSSFAWQRGYGAFSANPSDMESLLHYIDTQEEHHRKYNFQDELRALLKKYGIEHDERYMWD